MQKKSGETIKKTSRRETSTGQQVVQLHFSLVMMMMMMIL